MDIKKDQFHVGSGACVQDQLRTIDHLDEDTMKQSVEILNYLMNSILNLVDNIPQKKMLPKRAAEPMVNILTQVNEDLVRAIQQIAHQRTPQAGTTRDLANPGTLAKIKRRCYKCYKIGHLARSCFEPDHHEQERKGEKKNAHGNIQHRLNSLTEVNKSLVQAIQQLTQQGTMKPTAPAWTTERKCYNCNEFEGHLAHHDCPKPNRKEMNQLKEAQGKSKQQHKDEDSSDGKEEQSKPKGKGKRKQSKSDKTKSAKAKASMVNLNVTLRRRK